MSCPNHPDGIACPRNIALEAAKIIANVKTDQEAAAVAVEAMRMMLKASGTTRKGRGFAGITQAAALAKDMHAPPETTPK